MTADPYRPPHHDPSPGSRSDQDDAHNKHRKKRKRHRERPCGNPPAPPTGLVITYQVREAKTHLEFTGTIRWNEVTTDEQGHPTKIERYDVLAVPTNASGVPIDLDDASGWRLRAKIKQPLDEVRLDTATNPSGSTFRFVTKKNHGQSNGNKIRIKDCKSPTTYNGTYTVANVVNATTLEVVGGASGVADCDEPGIMVDADDRLHIVMEHLPRPKTWYWKVKARSVNVEGCVGDWTDWTTPTLPWTGADPEPPVPTYGVTPITFDRIGKGRRRKFRLKFTFDEVVDWDVPGGDQEDDMRAYVVQVDRSDDGVTWDGAPWYRKKMVMAKQDSDADTTRTVNFQVDRRQWYRCRVRSIDRFNRHGDWSDWTAAAWPNDNVKPPTPLNVRIFESATDRVVVDWEEPTIDYPTVGTVSGTSGTDALTGTGTKFTVEIEPGTKVKVGGNTYTVETVTSDTALTLTTNLSTSPSGSALFEIEEHPDVAYYEVQITKGANADTASTPDKWDAVYMRDKRPGTRRAFKVADADQGDPFYGRVRSVDMGLNKSSWIYAGSTASPNNNPNDNGVSSTISAGGGGVVVATFTKPGRLRERHYPYRWTNQTGQTLTFKRARAVIGIHDSATHPNDGCPRGSGKVRINLRRWTADETLHEAVLDIEDRLVIDAEEHKDAAAVAAGDFVITELEEDEAISVRVASVTSDFPGSDLVVQVFME